MLLSWYHGWVAQWQQPLTCVQRAPSCLWASREKCQSLLVGEESSDGAPRPHVSPTQWAARPLKECQWLAASNLQIYKQLIALLKCLNNTCPAKGMLQCLATAHFIDVIKNSVVNAIIEILYGSVVSFVCCCLLFVCGCCNEMANITVIVLLRGTMKILKRI